MAVSTSFNEPFPQIRASGRLSAIFRRLSDAVWYAQQRRALRDIEHVVAARGGLINDALEFEIGQQITRGGWDPGR